MDNEALFSHILAEECIETFFQPIVSFEDGSVFGYEALSRIALPSCAMSIEELFRLSYQKNKLWKLEKICRNNTLKNAKSQPSNTLLFINTDANIIHDTEFKAGFTSEKLQQYGIPAENIVFEITEKTDVADLDVFISSVTHYQKQNFKIAIDDFGSGYSGLNRVCSISAEFLKIDMSLIRDIDKNTKKKSAVASTVDFCHQIGVKVIAEGIETEAELQTLIHLGVDLGQGYYLSRPAPSFNELDNKKRAEIIDAYNKTNISYSSYAFDNISKLGMKKKTAKRNDATLTLFEQMKKDKEITEFFVLDEQDHICGILTRRYIFERFGGLFGYSLSMRTLAENIMMTEYLSVDEQLSIDKVADMAMKRSADHVYDSIAVTRNGKYLSTVTVKDLLLSSIQLQIKHAADANPLTGLPGNHQIQQVISTTFTKTTPWAIIYLDLDHFKAYNDAYGFNNGDLMIKAVAAAIKECCKKTDFLGHIGGDDFVIVVNSHDVDSLCRNISETFEQSIQDLYSPSDLQQGFIVSKDRNGFVQNFKLATLSIAVITNKTYNPQTMDELSKIIAQTKKICKQQEGNAIVVV